MPLLETVKLRESPSTALLPSPDQVGDWVLAPGTMVLPLQWATNTAPATWGPDPLAFRPERFLDPDTGTLRPDTQLHPFQLGRRRCIGEQLGRALPQLTLARLLQLFSVELEPGADIWAAPRHGFTLAPQPFRIKLTPRSKS